MKSRIIRSNRKTLGLEINAEGLIVRAPLYATDDEINEFLYRHREWIDRHQKKLEERRGRSDGIQPITEEELRHLAEKAMIIIPARVKYYAQIIGVTYGRITIRNQRSRWGSCSSKGNLNFNCLLMLTPDEVIDAVVVHELCHIKEMNHSQRFYGEIKKVYPDYDLWNRWLRENGGAILSRLPNN